MFGKSHWLGLSQTILCLHLYGQHIYFWRIWDEKVDFDFFETDVQHNTKRKVTKKVAKMNATRNEAACAVFKGLIVVSGGVIQHENFSF